MKDPEFIQLRNRFLMALGVVIVFTIPMFFLIINRFSEKPSKIIESINRKDNIVILVTEENCQDCNNSSKILKDNNISYHEINKDIDKNIYEKMLKKISMSNDDVISPTIIYLEEGKLNSSLVNPSDEELQKFLEYNKFSKTK